MDVEKEFEGYIEYVFGKLDKIIKAGLDDIKGKDLYRFYDKFTSILRDRYFGGRWGFQGYVEFIVYRILYHLLKSKNKPICMEVTSSVKAFYYPDRDIALAAGIPIKLSNGKIWPDIVIYRPESVDNNKLHGVQKVFRAIEVKLSPSISDIEKDINRLKSIYSEYNTKTNYLIIYGYNFKSPKTKTRNYIKEKSEKKFNEVKIINLELEERSLKEIFSEIIQL